MPCHVHPQFWKVHTDQCRFSELCIKLQFFNSDRVFSGKMKAALQDCFGCVFWKAVPFMMHVYIFTN